VLTGADIDITFPGWYCGNLRVVLMSEGSTFTGSAPVMTLGGNVTQLNDMYAATGSAGDLPFWRSGSVLTAGAGMLIIWHIRVQPATNSVDNTFKISSGFSAGTVNQTSLDISEYNSGFSYAANNLGSSVAPILVYNANTSLTVVPA